MRIETDHSKELIALCQKYYVASFALIGSAARGDMTEGSDIDFLVRFNDKLQLLDYADNFFDLKHDLEKLLGRSVDLVSEKSLKNPILIESIESSKRPIYEA